ncbi:AraC family transcriptional regulator [Aquimarina sp. U1-2]|uniref:helix-turn-helix domain-containing protein n=1 Tax=Aquimarina sp. U1-2 TaxID=2823141 RepID=UPI001AED0D33|nr:helix-turn-helix domain-containing protein [Aquimarina sp. U1-2]MBP2831055.1 AraC family transcriptional regulator [Aquimarina sp. U1-2]
MSQIPIHKTINELYEFLGSDLAKNAEAFHIATHEQIRELLPSEVKPFRNDFFEISIVLGGTSIEYKINQKTFKTPQQYLVFNAPGQVHKWSGIKGDLSGYVMFFKPEFVSKLFQERALSNFPFFNIYEANLFEVNEEKVGQLHFYYQQIFDNYYSQSSSANQLVKANLQAILWQCNQLYENKNQALPEKKETDGIVARYRHLVNKHFLSVSTVNEYAGMLNITPNYLSQIILQTLGINAKSIIDDRIILEADYLLTYSDFSIKEIGYSLNFDEPTHFTRFFKKHKGVTPGSFRK